MNNILTSFLEGMNKNKKSDISSVFMVKNMAGYEPAHFYFVAELSAVAVVESVADTAVVSTETESVVPSVVDFEPHAANVNITPTANTKIIFFIYF